MTDRKPYRHRFPLSIIQQALWLYHRFPLSEREVQELLHQRGIEVSHETLRQWNIKFAPLLTEELRHREPRRGSRWFLDEVYVEIGGRKHWLWRAVDETGAVLDILLQPHRDTQAAKTFFERLLGPNLAKGEILAKSHERFLQLQFRGVRKRWFLRTRRHRVKFSLSGLQICIAEF
ncbi:hypothetical protein GCM10022631_13730 [Deinococcus rubellus]